MDGFYGRGRTGHFVICFLQTSVVDFSDESLGDFMSCHVVVIGIDIALLGPFLDLRTRQKGVLDIAENNSVRSFREKSLSDGAMINAGYMVLQPEIFDYIEGDDTIF